MIASEPMTPHQRLVLIFGLLLMAAMAVFPPWLYVHNRPAIPGRQIDRGGRIIGGEPAQHSERPAGYHLLVGTHIPQDQSELARLFGLEVNNTALEYFSLRIDVQRLIIQMVAALVLVGGLYLILHRGQG